MNGIRRTEDPEYTARLLHLSGAQWKRLLPDPYRWWLRRQRPGFVLDVGCGIGRSLRFLDGNGVGVDHNPASVRRCRDIGLRAFDPDEFQQSQFARPNIFDTLLCSHVLEHVEAGSASELLRNYIRFLRPNGKVILISPQERGYSSDGTHVRFVDEEGLRAHAKELKLTEVSVGSFPLPRNFGRLFIYNEFVGVFRSTP